MDMNLSKLPELVEDRGARHAMVHERRELEGLMLKLRVQYSGHLMRRAASLEKTDAGKD